MKRGSIRLAIVALFVPCVCYSIVCAPTYEIHREPSLEERYGLLDASYEEMDNDLVTRDLVTLLIEPPGAASPTKCDNSCADDHECACDKACVPVACPGSKAVHKVCASVASAGAGGGSPCCDVPKTCEDVKCLSIGKQTLWLKGGDGVIDGLHFVLSKKAIGNHAEYKVCSVEGPKCKNDQQQNCGTWEFYQQEGCDETDFNAVMGRKPYFENACATTNPK